MDTVDLKIFKLPLHDLRIAIASQQDRTKDSNDWIEVGSWRKLADDQSFLKMTTNTPALRKVKALYYQFEF